MPSGSSSSSSGGGSASTTTAVSLCAFAAGASVGAWASLVYARQRLGAALPEVPAESRAAPLLSGVVSRLPPRARGYLPFSLEAYYDRLAAGTSAQQALDEGAAPATPTHGETAPAAPAAEDDRGNGAGNGAPLLRSPPTRRPSDLLLPLALTQRTDAPPGGGGGGGADAGVRSVPLSAMGGGGGTATGDLSESSALATPRGGDRGPPPSSPLRRAAAAAAAGGGAGGGGGGGAGKPPRPASSGGKAQQQQQQQQQQQAASAPASSRPSSSPSDYKLALVVRDDLRWTRQKTAVMCAHASVAAWKKAWKDARGATGGEADASALAKWEREKSPKVVLKAEDEAALAGLLDRAKGAGLPTHAMSEVGAAAQGGGGGGADSAAVSAPLKSRVILAIGPAPSEAINAIVGDLTLL